MEGVAGEVERRCRGGRRCFVDVEVTGQSQTFNLKLMVIVFDELLTSPFLYTHAAGPSLALDVSFCLYGLLLLNIDTRRRGCGICGDSRTISTFSPSLTRYPQQISSMAPSTMLVEHSALPGYRFIESSSSKN